MLGRKKQKRGGFRRAILLAGAALGGMYLLDPRMGRTRRARLADQARALFRRGTEDLEQKASYVGQAAYGTVRSTAGAVTPDAPPANDETLKEKIESEVLRGDDWPKGRLNVDVVNGIVTLRGELDDDDRRQDLEQQVRKISGVIDVQNLIHLPNTEAPNKAGALDASRKAERKTSG